jgi:hypothetical protein
MFAQYSNHGIIVSGVEQGSNNDFMSYSIAGLSTNGTNSNSGFLNSSGSMAFLSSVLLIIEGKGLHPKQFMLYDNYPNPFNPITRINYDLPEDALVNITIYDMLGRIVKTLINSKLTAGFKSIQWNATNDAGQPVSAGLYLYTIQAGEFRQTKKMVLLK